MQLRLDRFHNERFDRGRLAWIEACWYFIQALLVTSWVPGSWHRRMCLRLFGAKIGAGVVLKPGLRVKFPWRLVVGPHTWIGEDVWIDNLAPVAIGRDCCFSQGVYLCTGNHDWSRETFDLMTMPVTIHDHAWLAAKSVVAPGVVIGEGVVLGLGSVATCDLKEWQIYQGNPAVSVRTRKREQ
jgi:putative colanic acid biosynthesis acetyltransferase WcaF